MYVAIMTLQLLRHYVLCTCTIYLVHVHVHLASCRGCVGLSTYVYTPVSYLPVPLYRRVLDQVQLLLEDVAVTEVIMDDRDMKLVSNCAYLLCTYMYMCMYMC